MLLTKVKVYRNEHESTIIDIPAWEVPVAQVVHSPEHVNVVGEFEIDREYPDPQAEYTRLENRYKKDVASDEMFVAAVYGKAPMGIRKLAEAIQEAQEDESTRPSKVAVVDTDPTA